MKTASIWLSVFSMVFISGVLISGCDQGEVLPVDSGDPRTVTVSWQAPTLNLDDSPITNLSEYRIYVSSNSSDYQMQASIPANATSGDYQQQTTVALPPGRYFIALTAVDGENNESIFSNTICREIAPSASPCP